MTASASPSTAHVVYRERLTPSAGAWVVIVALGIFLGVVFYPLGVNVAAAVAVVAVAVLIVVNVLTAPVVAITQQSGTDHASATFSAGPAHIPVRLTGEPSALNREQWSNAMSTQFNPEDFHCTRGWIATGVYVPVTDPHDSTRGWLVSTRHPDEVVLALLAVHENNRAENGNDHAEHSRQ